MLTGGVAAPDDALRAQVLEAVRTFKDFDEGNDPHNEHDMVFVEVSGQKYWSKIDNYDLDERYLSDDGFPPQQFGRALSLLAALSLTKVYSARTRHRAPFRIHWPILRGAS